MSNNFSRFFQVLASLILIATLFTAAPVSAGGSGEGPSGTSSWEFCYQSGSEWYRYLGTASWNWVYPVDKKVNVLNFESSGTYSVYQTDASCTGGTLIDEGSWYDRGHQVAKNGGTVVFQVRSHGTYGITHTYKYMLVVTKNKLINHSWLDGHRLY